MKGLALRQKKITWFIGVGALFLGLFLLNSSWLANPPADGPSLLAHRGLAQGFVKEGLTNKTCTAERMTEPSHDYLENTIRSIRESFDLGADVVEFDILPTIDGRFAVFHDWLLECRTNGQGETRKHTLAELQQLDIGFGYTTDGISYPFRGRGIGAMPSLSEVLSAFPNERLLINIKGGDRSTGSQLVEVLAGLQVQRRRLLSVYGAHNPTMAVREELPEVRTFSIPLLRKCLPSYMAVGWSGFVPASCRRAVLTVPVNVGPWLWGWPNRFMARMQSVGTEVFVFNRYSGEGFSSGLDSAADLDQLPSGYRGGIWTDRIDIVSEIYGRN